MATDTQPSGESQVPAVADHEHDYREWLRDEPRDWWERKCQVSGCEWRQVTTSGPTGPHTPWDRAMFQLAGIDPTDSGRSADA